MIPCVFSSFVATSKSGSRTITKEEFCQYVDFSLYEELTKK